MASLKKNKFGSDDEDDLESLRLAALKSLKPKSNPTVVLKPLDVNHGRVQNVYKQHPTFGAAQTTRNHNRGFRNNGGRMGRNGINPRIRGNPNLISIQVIDDNETKEPTLDTIVRATQNTDAPKLILPQDRYHKTQSTDVVIKEKESVTNKFDRYKNSSDESDSDSDESSSIPAKRERKNSLEALMDDIDNILEGKEEKKPEEIDDEKIDTVTINSQASLENDNLKEDDSQKEANDTLIIEEIDPDIVQMIENEEKSSPSPSPRKEETITNSSSSSNINQRALSRSRSRSRSPYLKKSRSRSRSVKSRSKSPYNKIKSSPPYRSPRRSPIRKRYSPLPYSRPLPNLTLNTDVLNTITMAPLSPRSAAFVLENRQILARRQMSPSRRSPPSRRSSSPKRMKLSPRRRTRSPRSRSPIRKCSLSPRKRSNSPKFSPKRRSTSPRNYTTTRRSPNLNRYKNRNSNSPLVKQSVHKRLGTKNSSPHDRKPDVTTTTSTKRKRTSRSISLSLSPSPDRNYHKRPLNETTGQLNEKQKRKEDPVLLARKRKFESPVQLGKNNGVIKLNTKKSETQNKETADELSDAQPEEQDDETPEKEFTNDGSDIEIELNTNMDDLWSDEESDNENEGRFKSKTITNRKTVPTISIRNLTEKPIPKETLLSRERDHFRSYSDRDKSTRLENIMPSSRTSYNDRDKSTKRSSKYDSTSRRTKTSKSESLKKSSHEKTSSKSKTSRDKSDNNTDKNKNINDDIESSKDTLKILPSSIEEKPSSRRVKINAEPEVVLLDSNTQNTDEPEIIIENDDDDDAADEVVPKNDDESDLRAEISRRRAERLQKAGSIAGGLPTRLLKSALQEVVPKRQNSKMSTISKGSANAADRKVLIIKSLASSPTVTKIEPANKVIKSKKEIGKLPIHMRLGQTKTNMVSDACADEVSDDDVDDGVRGRDRERERERERRSKKSRPSKRKNRKVVQV